MTDQLRPNTSSSSSSPSAPTTAITAAPSLCTNQCGFYGNPKQDGMCSKCYKTTALKKAAEAAAASSASLPSPTASPADTTAMPGEGTSAVEVSVGGAEQCEDIPIFRSSISASQLPPLSFSDSITIPLTSPEASPLLSAARAPSPQLTTTPASIDLASSASASSSSAATATSSSSLSPPLASLSLASAVTPAPAPISLPAVAAPAAAAVAVAAVAGGSDKKRKNRCLQCSVKVGLTYFSCRCDESAMFCAAHRYPHSHHCAFDAKQQQKDKLTKANPVCAHDKLERI